MFVCRRMADEKGDVLMCNRNLQASPEVEEQKIYISRMRADNDAFFAEIEESFDHEKLELRFSHFHYRKVRFDLRFQDCDFGNG